jgi:integrase/recombinase XerD
LSRIRHLPLGQWPEVDRAAFAAIYKSGDIFDDARGCGAHLAQGTRRMIRTAYRRWLGFLDEVYPRDLLESPADRITQPRVRAFVDRLSCEVRPMTIAIVIDNLLIAARLLAPQRDWNWLRLLKRRLRGRATPHDRFDHLVPGWSTLDLGMRLMEEATSPPRISVRDADIKFRDGLLLALLSCWPIRRRSIAALSVKDHLEFVADGINFLLHAPDTKTRRSEVFRVPERLLPHVCRYLKEIRPRLRKRAGDGFWLGSRGTLSPGRIYDIVRRETEAAFGRPMGLHDFRRAGATFWAMTEPAKVGLIPGILQHSSPEVSEKHYNLARSVDASRRLQAHVFAIRAGRRRRRRRAE